MKMPRRVFIASIIKVTGNVNADLGVGTRIPLKKIFTQRQEVKTFVSARCIRRCIRERLSEKDFSIDPLTSVGEGERAQLGDVGNPLEYVDDDLFGYLVPEAVPRKRSSPVKISHLISLKHTEVKPEFAARFPRDFLPKFEERFPAPFEIEVAEWLGRLDIILSDKIGCFQEHEIPEEEKPKLTKQNNRYYLDASERQKRLRALLEVLLWEGWQFPRSAQSPSIPEFHYAVVALTMCFTPIFGYIDIDDDNKLCMEKIGIMKKLYSNFIDDLYILDYKTGKYQNAKKQGEKLKEQQGELNSKNLNDIINKICKHIISDQ
jgi:CRISPR-associated protein Cas7/Cst2/DevR subtype I-B